MDWFEDFDSNDQRTNGLEFVEGLWADKLAAVAILATVGIITASIVWCVKGGDLQTVFTVMGFVLTLVAGKLFACSGLAQRLTQKSPNCVGGTILPNHPIRLWIVEPIDVDEKRQDE